MATAVQVETQLHELWDEVLDSQRWSEGELVERFEDAWGTWNGLPAVAFSSWAGAAMAAGSAAGASTSRPTSGTAGRNSDSISVIVAWIALRRLMATSTVTPGLAWSARSSAAKADR